MVTDLIYEKAGITFTGSQAPLFEKRALKRMDALELTSMREYYHYLKYDAKRESELTELLNELTVNETYFFREKPQLEVFAKEILPYLKEKNKLTKRIKIWSAGSSTGCEVYSLAIIVKESGLFDTSWRIMFHGSDINTEVLNYARDGVYTESAFRIIDPAIQKKYFTETGEKTFTISSEIKKMVNFSHINLFNERQMKTMVGFDVIFCRNVLIYFDIESRKTVANSFNNSLHPGSYFFLGQSESLFKVTTLFQLKPMQGVLLYYKPEPQ